ncbi:hypothetical protein CYMTET_7795 [Cymbomonas tetramitiformis]|uniref:Uncharacterized protein n=1 Tax=Cymbomonas tetramitiformis TaxID=36881 RepID=A0AAE0LH50_9CHLO|nr:hypothetical protein CYMTET_7795 [Cymbomonas tetramitiformis]
MRTYKQKIGYAPTVASTPGLALASIGLTNDTLADKSDTVHIVNPAKGGQLELSCAIPLVLVAVCLTFTNEEVQRQFQQQLVAPICDKLHLGGEAAAATLCESQVTAVLGTVTAAVNTESSVQTGEECSSEERTVAASYTYTIPGYEESKTLSSSLINVVAAFDALGFERVLHGSEEHWDVMWSFHYPFTQFKDSVKDMKPLQRVNHLPGSSAIISKEMLVKNWESVPFIPPAFKTPQNLSALKSFVEENPNEMWVVKAAKHRGVQLVHVDGIDVYFADDIRALEEGKNVESTFMQQYIRNALLIDGHRWDIGVYVAVTALDPLRVYIFDDFLLRFCSEPYIEERAAASGSVDSYVVGDHYIPPWKMPSLENSFARGLTAKKALRSYLGEAKFRTMFKMLENSIAYILQTIAMPSISKAARSYGPDAKSNFFAMWRMDFMLDDKMKPWLLEVNLSPNLSHQHTAGLRPMFLRITSSLLSLVGIAPENRTLEDLPVANAESNPTHPHIVPRIDVEVSGAGECTEVTLQCKPAEQGGLGCASDPILCKVCRRACRTQSETNVLVSLAEEQLSYNLSYQPPNV